MHTAGASHISLSVSDFARSLRWYREVFAAEVLFDENSDSRDAAVLTLPGTDLLVGLAQFHQRDDAPFNPTRTGLDHFGFAVASRDALDAWAEHLDHLGVVRSGPLDIPSGAILNFKDPDDIALALMWRR